MAVGAGWTLGATSVTGAAMASHGRSQTTHSGTRSATDPVASSVSAATNVLPAGGALEVGQSLTSTSGAYRLVLQGDGNLVLYDGSGRPIWSSGTNGSSVQTLAMQYDGNLVLYSTAGVPLWWTGTSPSPKDTLVVTGSP